MYFIPSKQALGTQSSDSAIFIFGGMICSVQCVFCLGRQKELVAIWKRPDVLLTPSQCNGYVNSGARPNSCCHVGVSRHPHLLSNTRRAAYAVFLDAPPPKMAGCPCDVRQKIAEQGDKIAFDVRKNISLRSLSIQRPAPCPASRGRRPKIRNAVRFNNEVTCQQAARALGLRAQFFRCL